MCFLVIFRTNRTYIKILKETTHEIAQLGLYHNYAKDRSDEVLEMVVCIFLFITKKIKFQSFNS